MIIVMTWLMPVTVPLEPVLFECIEYPNSRYARRATLIEELTGTLHDQMYNVCQ
jgi:hypothetical protein